MNIEKLRKENDLINLFCTLAEIPSPSMGEDNVATEIVSTLLNAGLEVKRDESTARLSN